MASLPGLVEQLCEMQQLQLGPGDAEAVAEIYAAYLRLIDVVNAAPLEPEAVPPLRLTLDDAAERTGSSPSP